MPEHMTDTEGENPISMGTSTVAPNMERKCWSPKGNAWIGGSFSSTPMVFLPMIATSHESGRRAKDVQSTRRPRIAEENSQERISQS